MTDVTYVLEKQLPKPAYNEWEATGFFKSAGAATYAFHTGHGHRRMRALIEHGKTCTSKTLKQV